MTVFYLLFEAAPHPTSEHFLSCGGAYVNCWVNALSARQAHKMAASAIVENGWMIIAIEEQGHEVTEQWYMDDAETLEYFEQAVSDKIIPRWRGEPFDGRRTAHQIKRFIAARARSVRAQLDGKSKGLVLDLMMSN